MIGSSENRVSYNGNGTATEFAFSFKILERTDMNVLLVAADGTETLLTKDYYVDMERNVVVYPGYAPGAEIPESERPAVLTAGERLVLYREVPITQESQLDTHWPFNVIEDGLDKLTIICQQIWGITQRCLKISTGTENFNPTVPVEAGKTIKISDDGTHFENTLDPAVVYPLCIAQQEEATEQASIAKDRAAAALASETAAKNSENNAKGSETAANSSKLAAAQSEANASQSASVATIAAQAAASSASEASTTLDNVKSYDDTYKAYMDSSEAFANTASSAKNAAQTSASEAGASASEASGYAATAASKATEATNQASAAATKATEAAASADRAEQFADKVQDIAQLELPLSITNGGTGNSTGQAPSAISDGDGNVIKDTYLPLTGGTVSGGLNVTGTLSKGGTAVSLEGHTHTVSDVSGVLPIANGGTGASNASDALLNLGGVKSVNGVSGDSSGNITLDTMPTGTVIPFAGSTTPSGYLLCNGANVSRTTYSALYSVIGTTYGTGDGSTTFALPNASTGILITGNIPLSGNADVYGNGKAIKFTNGNTSTFGLSVYESAGTKLGRILGFAYESANLPNQQDSAMMVISQSPGIGLATKSIGYSAVYADTSSITANTSNMPKIKYCIKY